MYRPTVFWACMHVCKKDDNNFCNMLVDQYLRWKYTEGEEDNRSGDDIE